MVPNIADTRKLARTASTAAPVDLRRLLGYVGAVAGGAAAALRPESAKGGARSAPRQREGARARACHSVGPWSDAKPCIAIICLKHVM